MAPGLSVNWTFGNTSAELGFDGLGIVLNRLFCGSHLKDEFSGKRQV